MIQLLVYILILCLVFGLIWWVIGLLPIPQPFRNIVLVILAIILIVILLGMIGVLPGTNWRLVQ